MKSFVLASLVNSCGNTLMSRIIDTAEKVLKTLDLHFSRIDDNELSVSLAPNYNLSVFLRSDYEILHFSNDLGLVCPENKLAIIEDSIVKANERIWTGHFDLLSTDNRIVYSLSLPLINSFILDEESFESILDMITEESERFYYYFQMVISDKQIPNFSINTLFQEAVGEA